MVTINHPSQEELNQAFMQDFKHIFLKHIEAAIDKNKITLDVKKSRLQSLSNEQWTSHHQPMQQDETNISLSGNKTKAKVN